MARAGLGKNVVVKKVTQLANKVGIDQIQLKTLAGSLSIQPPSLYSHIRGLDDLCRGLIIYGWKQVEKRMPEAASGADGYVTWEAICWALYQYTTESPGMFGTMLQYNRYQDKETQGVAGKLFSICFAITSFLNVSKENCNHLIRTFRASLEGFCLLVNDNAFGYSLPVEESFNLSLKMIVGGMKELEGK